MVSGETISNRPMMRLLLERLESGTVSAVLCIEPQRLTRGDLTDCGTIINAFRYTGTAVITPMKTYNLEDKFDRRMFQAELLQGNDYLEYTKEILRRGKVASAKDGNYVGGRAPYGYRKVYRDERRHRRPTLEIVPEQAEAVRLIYEIYSDGKTGVDAIAAKLDELGYRPPSTAKGWNRNTIHHMLKCPTYIGTVYYGKRKSYVSMEGGEFHKKSREQEEYIEIPNCHPAIISLDTFRTVQERLKTNPHTKTSEIINPLAGLLRCGKCGRAMYLRRQCGHRTALYSCTGRGKCGMHSGRYAELYSAVIDAIDRELGSIELQSDDDFRSKAAAVDRRRKELEKKLAALTEKENRLMDFLENGVYSVSVFQDRKKLLEDERAAINRQIHLLQEDIPHISPVQRRTALSDALRVCRSSDSIPDINAALRSCIATITYHNDHDIYQRTEAASKDFRLDIEFRI